jgi:RNA polymerase sigma-70 factor (ECF subfamily)
MALPQREAGADAAALAARETLQDARAVARVLQGDAEAYGELVGRYMRRAFAIAYRIVEQREDAEDVVQDAFIRGLERLDTLQRGRPFRPWFFRIVVNQALNLRRGRAVRRTEPVPEQAASKLPTPELQAERAVLRGVLTTALDALPETQRTVVVLAELEQLTSAEIATIMELSPGTVRWHLHQARRALRQSLQPLVEDT